MSIKLVEGPPTEPTLLRTESDERGVHAACSDDEFEQIAEAFDTPLRVAYNWDYRVANRAIGKLYRLGKARNWNAELDLDWSQTHPLTQYPQVPGGSANPYDGWAPFEALDENQRRSFAWHQFSWMLCQFLHGEQGGLLVASQLVNSAPTYEAKLYAASQAFDEARHVEVFGRYVREKLPVEYPVNRYLKALLDKVLTDPRWDLKFIGIQLVIESLALAAFGVQKVMSADPLLQRILDLVVGDEARHVAFGVTYMEQFVRALPEHEVEDRATFAYEACRVMRERIIPTDVFEHWGMDPREGRERYLRAGQMDTFRNLLFTRIMPNLKKVGLLTERVMPCYDELGLLQFADLPHDGDIDWAALERSVL